MSSQSASHGDMSAEKPRHELQAPSAGSSSNIPEVPPSLSFTEATPSSRTLVNSQGNMGSAESAPASSTSSTGYSSGDPNARPDWSYLKETPSAFAPSVSTPADSQGSKGDSDREDDLPNNPLLHTPYSQPNTIGHSPMSGNHLQSRKRPRAPSSSLKSPELKNRRTTPSVTRPSTPSSVDSSDMDDEQASDLQRLLGFDPREDFRQMRKEQKEVERQLQLRKEQERKDAEFAAQLAADLNDSDIGAASYPTHDNENLIGSMPAFGSTGMAPPPTRQGSHLPPPYSSNGYPSQQTQAPTSRDRAFGSLARPSPVFGRPSSMQSIKQEAPISPPAPRAPIQPFQRNFVELSSDSSDVEEVTSSNLRKDSAHLKPTQGSNSFGAFRGPPSSCESKRPIKRERQGGWNALGSSDDETPTHLRSASAFHPTRAVGLPSISSRHSQGQPLAGYGGTSVYGTPTSHHPTPSPGMLDHAKSAIYGAGNYLANKAYGLIDNDIASYGSSPYGYRPDPFSQSPYGGQLPNPTDPLYMERMTSYMDRWDYVSNDPTRTKEELKALLENIRPDQDIDPRNREGTPDAMRYPLMEHQKVGLTWLKSMEEGSNKGGILADDMGLGKTIQALALMVSRPSPDPNQKTNLIIAPVALLQQWKREIEKKLKPGPEYRLSVHILHGQQRTVPWQKLKKFDVVLTTFGTLASELKRKLEWAEKKKAHPNIRPTGTEDVFPTLGDECKWYRIIVDEAQCIKNKNTKAAQACASIAAKYRLCMTGTPMMNSVTELYSLIRFLRIAPYNVSEKFNMDFAKPLKGNYPEEKEQAMKKLQALLKAILLRRTKKSKIDGQPILNLPERTTELQHAVFSEDEHAFYTALENQTQLAFNKYLKAGTVGRNYSNVLVLLLRLRQACCHPHLIKDFGIQGAGTSEMPQEDLLAFAKELPADVVARLAAETAFECPICFDGVENPTIFIPCGHNTCSECFARISDPTQALNRGDEGNAEVKCPNCRGRVNAARVTDYISFKKAHMPHLLSEDELKTPNAENDEAASSSEEEDDADDSDDDIKNFVVDDEEDLDVASNDEDDDDLSSAKGKNPFEMASKAAVGKTKASAKNKSKSKSKSKGKGKGKGKAKHSIQSLAQLKKEATRSRKAHKKYMRRLEAGWESSAKIEKTMSILEETQQRGKGEKTIIFSQFTSLLDLLEVPVSRQGWGYKRYDGSMSPKERNEAVLEFTDNPRCQIMLVSLKAGNSGLNLVAASQVIIFDPFWNPYIEEQAIDRAHRIGQLRPVQVHRILVKETVEDRILALQEKKRELIEGALDEHASARIGRLGERELAFLFVSFPGVLSKGYIY